MQYMDWTFGREKIIINVCKNAFVVRKIKNTKGDHTNG